MFHANVLARLAAMPGVQSVGAVSWRPMGDMGIMGDFEVQGATPRPKGYTVDKPTVSPGYFRTMGIRILHGRDFSNADAAGAMRAALSDVDRAVPAQSLQTMNASMLDLVADFVFQTTLLGVFSLLALLLAAIGTYGVLAYDVAERTREIGIRMALGARTNRVLQMVLGRTLALAGIGIVIGVLGAFGTTRVLARFLFGVSPTDPAAFGATALVLVAVALAAATVPAWRASRVDPVIALRAE